MNTQFVTVVMAAAMVAIFALVCAEAINRTIHLMQGIIL